MAFGMASDQLVEALLPWVLERLEGTRGGP